MEKYKTPEPARRLANLMLASGALGRPMLGTPGIPADRVKILDTYGQRFLGGNSIRHPGSENKKAIPSLLHLIARALLSIVPVAVRHCG